jgi:hypothetical protein
LPFWGWQEGTLEIPPVQRLPGQTRVFCIGLGFYSAAATRVPRGCVFQTILCI